MEHLCVAEWTQPEGLAVDALYAETYRDLRRLAHVRLRASRRDTLLDTTVLVHESYLRLAAAGQLQLKDRAHFLRYAGRAMRSVIVDLVRKRQAACRGGSAAHVTLNTAIADSTMACDREILRVHQALRDLSKVDPRMVQIVEMRYFAGMTEDEIAETLGIADRTVRREWEKARLWLSDALS